MVLDETYRLSNGMLMPKLGLGTWMVGEDEAADLLKTAVQVGYRHFDTAQGYANERGVGQGIRECGLRRQDLFITTKVLAECKSYDEAKSLLEDSLSNLGTDYIDLMLIHSPQPWMEFRGENRYFEENLEVWKALEEAVAAGAVRAIGVSNFERQDLENLLANCTIRPATNQVLCHIGNTPWDMIDFCRAEGILVQAYSPFAHGHLFENPVVSQMAEAYDVTVAQIGLRYCLQIGVGPLPKTVGLERLKQNAELDFEISDEDMETLSSKVTISDYGDDSVMPVFGSVS